MSDWTHVFDFTQEDHDFSPHASRGDWQSGSGWGTNSIATFKGLIQLNSPEFCATYIDSVTIHISQAMTGNTEDYQFWDDEIGTGNQSDVDSSGTLSHTFTVNDTLTQFAIGVADDDQSSATQWSGYITQCEVSGQGTNPFEEWTYEFDFTKDKYGWKPLVTVPGYPYLPGERAIYVANEGWKTGSSYHSIQIERDFRDEATITEIEIQISQTLPGNQLFEARMPTGHNFSDFSKTVKGISGLSYTFYPCASSTGLYVSVQDDERPHQTVNGYIRKVILKGIGMPPFAPKHEGEDCDLDIYAPDDNISHNPISYRTGEKQEKVTDISVNTPAGELAFIRSYRQSKLDGDSGNFPQHMGLGWSHNHNIWLHDDISSSNEIYVYMPNGGRAHFEENTSTEYVAKAGGTSKITIDSGSTSARYTLETSNQTYIFDEDGKLQSRDWSNGEAWTYSYYTTSDYKEGLLEKVSDGYSRELKFSYINNSGQFDHQQLWRVGDHDSSGLDTGSPSGRYVEFAYVTEKSNGSVVTNAKPLLYTVQDLRGETWVYDWYGQAIGETDSNQLNWLTEYQSPSVDTDGDGTTNNSLILKRLTYTFSGSDLTDISEEMGIDGSDVSLTTDFAFQPSGNNITTETTGGKTITHNFYGENYIGMTDASDNTNSKSLDGNYRSSGQLDASGNATQMVWSTDGKTLSSVVDAEDNTTSFTYDNSDRLLTSTDTEGRKTEYSYDDVTYPNLRQPETIKIRDASDNLLRVQEFVYDSKGRATSEKDIDPITSAELRRVERQYYSSGNGNGLLEWIRIYNLDDLTYMTYEQTSYMYDSVGRVIQVNKNSTFGNCTVSRTLYDEAGNVIASICNYDDDGGTHSAPTESTIDTWYSTVGLVDKNQVTKHEYDAMGRRVKTTSNLDTSFEKTTLVIYDALNRVTHQIANYVDASYDPPADWAFESGEWKDGVGGTSISHGSDLNENIISRTEYNDRGLVRLTQDHLGIVTLFGYNDADRLVKTVQNASTPSYDNNYSGDTDLSAYPDSTASNDTDIITEQAYDAVGNLVKSVDPVGRVTYTVYDALNRPVKVVANAKDTSTIALNDGDVGYDATLDPRSSSYVISTAPDRDQVTTTEYDALGRVVQSKRLLDKIGTTETCDTTYFVYDKLGRQTRTIQHYVPQTSTELPDLWVWDATDNRWEESNGTAIEHGTNDQNIITETFYNVEGQVSHTIDSMRRETHYGYDGLQRQTISVANFNDNTYDPLADWEWDGTTDNRWEDGDNTPIAFGSDNDENIISHTEYDDSSYVKFTRDVDGQVTRFVYDELGRQIRTIQNYVAQGATNPKDWIWDDSTTQWEYDGTNQVGHGTHDDENLISDTVYDEQGRVQSTRDHLGNVNLYGYDSANRRIKVVQNASNPSYDVDSDPNLSAYTWSSPNADQDRISTTVYDVAGRVQSTTEANGNVSYFVYDDLGRRVRTVQNYVAQGSTIPADWLWDDTDGHWEDGLGNAIVHTSGFDENLITETVYDKAGQVTEIRDLRGTKTTFAYDDSGRRVRVTQAEGTVVASLSYTCYDKAGRVLRMIANWHDDGTNPDERDTNGDWVFDPMIHGSNNDQNLVTEYIYDNASRRVTVTNPNGDGSQTSYFKDGTVDMVTDPEGVVTAYLYDGLRRRVRVIQNFVGTTPENWVWSGSQWEDDATNPIAHGTNNDQNIIVDVDYDTLGRMTQLRDPRGKVTSYEYDQLGRRTKLTNPLSQEWVTAYENVGNVTKTTVTYPGINGSSSTYDVARDFDRLGRLTQINYNDAANTPTVQFTYDSDGNRQKMTEVGASATVRETTYGYDELGRLTSVGFDTDGSGTPDETVSYAYDIASNRTKLTLPDATEISYEYDDKGRLVKMTDFGNNVSTFAYDNVNRHIATMRQDGFRSHYQYDASGRLKRLRHHDGSQTLADFLYEVDARGNRTKATELLRTSGASMATTVIAHDDTDIEYSGTWSAVSGFQETTQIGATLRFEFLGNTNVELTMGEGDDHSIYDVYVNETLWQSYDGYASVSGERVIDIPLTNDDVNVLEVRNTMDVNSGSGGRKVRFKQLSVDSDVTMQTIDYTYDALSRLLEADYSNDRNYLYQYDLAGNRTQQQTTIGITTTTTNWTYNNANQMATMQIGANPVVNMLYDNNGNLTDDGVLTYTWDSANRLKTLNNGTYNTHFAYDGNGDRHQQNVGGTITNYLLDVQPELALVLGETVGANTTSYVHAPMGVHSAYDGTDWTEMVHDGLGSVRSQVDATGAVVSDQWYDPYGQVIDDNGTWVGSFGYAGEQTDESGLGYNRARYYNPAMGAFASLDPFEGIEEYPMSMNGYSYAENNPTNWTDPSGEFVGAAVGAVVGGVVGGISSYFFANTLFEWALNGECGCPRKEWAWSLINSGQKQNFLNFVTFVGAASGAIFGALATIPGASLILSRIGMALGTVNAGMSILDILMNGLNKCNALELLLSLAGIVLSALGANSSFKFNLPKGLPPTGLVPVGAGISGGTSAVSTATSTSISVSGGVVGGIVSGTGTGSILEQILFAGDGKNKRGYSHPGSTKQIKKPDEIKWWRQRVKQSDARFGHYSRHMWSLLYNVDEGQLPNLNTHKASIIKLIKKVTRDTNNVWYDYEGTAKVVEFRGRLTNADITNAGLPEPYYDRQVWDVYVSYYAQNVSKTARKFDLATVWMTRKMR